MGTDPQPFVSVVTPVYNGESFLAECIESVLAQTYTNIEYIIVNNHSTDRTLEIAQSYADKDGRIQVYSNEAFVGAIENHNIALRYISPNSKYCKVVSADDWIFRDCLTQMVELAEANPSVGMVGSYTIAGKKIVPQGLEYETKVVSGSQLCYETLKGHPQLFGAPTWMLYRSDLIRRSNDFFPGSNPHADVAACYQWLKDCDFGFVHQLLSYTRIQPDSQSTHSIKLGTINLARIERLLQFGPQYMLSEKEQTKCLNELMDVYYRFLASNIHKQLGNGAFWQYHKTELRKLGLRLSPARLCVASFIYYGPLLLKPWVVVRKIFAIILGSDNKPKNEGLYY